MGESKQVTWLLRITTRSVRDIEDEPSVKEHTVKEYTVEEYTFSNKDNAVKHALDKYVDDHGFFNNMDELNQVKSVFEKEGKHIDNLYGREYEIESITPEDDWNWGEINWSYFIRGSDDWKKDEEDE